MRKIVLILMVVALTACNRSCNYSTANLNDIKLCNDPKDKQCPGDQNKFRAAETDTLYLSGVLNNAPKDTKITVKWYFHEEGKEKEEIAKVDFATDGKSSDYPVYAYLYPPSAGWPLGKYSVIIDFGTDNTDPIEKKFEITE